MNNNCSFATLFDSYNPHHIYFIGIGGIGMSGLAEILLGLGYQVSGSDCCMSKRTERLRHLGATIHQGHAGTHIEHVDWVIYSSAIAADNLELLAAQAQNIPIWHRGKLLAALMSCAQGIAVAGTHGKTTTTGMIDYLLENTAFDPTTINGGMRQGACTTVRLGKSDYFVAEADESDVSFLWLTPKIAIVTNIEADHLENYAGSFAQLKDSFNAFINKVPPEGLLVCGIDDPVVRSLISDISQIPLITFGFSSAADICAVAYWQEGLHSFFRIKTCPRLTNANDMVWELSIPGRHNVQNALAAMAVGLYFGLDIAQMQQRLLSFPGMGRRFHLCGHWPQSDGKKCLLYTDYGHHPSEIAATIAAARLAWPQRRLITVFQPHRYSRTQALLQDFIKVLSQTDVVVLLDIYAADEKPIPEFSSKILYQLLRAAHPSVHYLSTLAQLPDMLLHLVRAEDVVFLQGAGSIGTQAIELLANIPTIQWQEYLP